MLKTFLYSLFFCLLINLGTSWAAQQPVSQKTIPPQKPEPVVPLNRIVAIVNDEIITETDLKAFMDQLKPQMTADHPMPSAEQFRTDALDQLITRRLQLQMANRNGIKATPEEVDAALEQIAKSHDMTIDQMKAEMAAQHVDYTEFRKNLTEQLIINKLQQQMVALQVKVTDADIAAYKNSLPESSREYHLVDFFIPLPERATSSQIAGALATAKSIQNQISSGTDVDKITPAYHDLGWRNKQNLPDIFVQQLPILTLNNTSPPLRAPNGYHLLKLLGMRTTANLSDEQIKEIILRKKYEDAVREAVNKAKNQAYIKIIPQ